MDSTTRCITTPGCRSFNFLPDSNIGGTRAGDCVVVIAPVVSGDGTLVMADKGWTLYELVMADFILYETEGSSDDYYDEDYYEDT